jgi:hypothetical protein
MAAGWTYLELAAAIGLRALGDDADAIAGTLARDRDDVIRTLRHARALMSAGCWVEQILDCAEAEDAKPTHDELIAPFRARRFVMSPLAPTARPVRSRSTTATLMGDPAPGRSALDQRQRQGGTQ